MTRHRNTFYRLLAGFLLGSVAALQPLVAQLDPKLQGSKTDFLDLYQQSVNLVMKPEVVSVFDFSGSMAEVMWHPLYSNSAPNGWGGMVFTLTGPGNGTSTYRDKHGSNLPAGRYEVTVTLNSGLALTGGALVRPDGSLLEYATGGDTAINSNYTASTPALSGESAVPKASDIRNWIRSASHVRFTYGTVTHDLPICWTILDSDTTVDLDNPNINLRQFRKSYNTSYPLKMTIINPGTTSNTEIEMDSAYRLMSQTANADFGMFSSVTGTNPMTKCTFQTANNTSRNFVGWGNNYIKWLFQTATAAQVPRASTDAGKAFKNGIPARTRVQAVKDAAMRTWCKYYNKVFWAYRFLKYFEPGSVTEVYDSDTYPSNDSRHDGTSSNPTATPIAGQSQRGWVLLNSNSDTGLKRLAAMICGGSTPLNAAMANTLAQLNDPNCIFNDIETGVDKPVECRNTYLILFTDGIPNTDMGGSNTLSPYFSASSTADPVVSTLTGTANIGNTWWASKKTNLDTGTYYNIINLAGLAAHGGETDNGGVVLPAYPTTTDTYTSAAPNGTIKNSDWIPFWLKGRGAGAEAITFKKPRPITTMTVGVSLTGTTITRTGTKYRLFAAAACGDPGRTEWDLNTLTPFTLNVPSDPSKGKTPGSVYFFDATDPAKLTTGLDAAFFELSLASNVNVTSNPNLPFVGASFGNQIYLGKFQPPATGGVIWPGDVLMFGTREVNGQTVIIDKSGNTTATTDETTAQWSAKSALVDKLWKTRKLYTRLPGASALKPFTDIGTDFTDATTGLQKFVATSMTDLADRQKVVQFAAGGDLTKPGTDGRPTGNRPSIMGDVINSAPSVIEYKWLDVKDLISSYPRLNAVDGNRFRLLLVGTNQGWLHAFGEVTKKSSVVDATNVTREIVTGDVEELWSFMPTDFLANLNYITSGNNPHRFMVDGTPAIYHLDLPPTTGGSGNGVVDTTERAVAVIGLRKGGRSYYALDIRDPFTPSLKWSMVPDEAATFSASQIVTGGPALGTVTDILGKWGYSSCTPAFGRVQFNSVIRDAVFLGGGFSTPEIEANFANAKLGRSVMAIDVYTGEVLAASDLTHGTIGGNTVGPIGAGVIPFEFVLNSGMAQRAYFLDYRGGLWSWGSKAVSPSVPYMDFRQDTSQITDWKIRKVFQDDDTVAKGARYTTLPAPFRVGSFPGVGKPGSAAPAAAGIAMVSGDRNNPLDREYDATTNPAPVNHRLTVVFDRQDSRAWNFDTATGPDDGIKTANLKNFSNNVVSSTPTNACGDAVFGQITPGCPNYYLSPYSGLPPVPGTPAFGYYINFPSIAGGFIPKGINPPLVVAGSLFYAYFSPSTSDPCTGGSGTTNSYLTTDVMNPLVTDNRGGLVSVSGLKFTWAGVASDFFAIGTRAVLQGGALGVSDPKKGESATTMGINTIQGSATQRFPKPRVWRTVH